MIKNLYIKNFVLFEDVKVDFQNNINALVGNTGAGKSVIFSAIQVLCGQRNIKKYIMKNKDYYELEMTVDITNIDKDNFIKINKVFNIEDSEELIVYRKLSNDSKADIKINNKTITLNILKDVMNNLVEIHFQNTTDKILEVENQINIIDDLINNKILEEYKVLYSEYESKKRLVKKLNLEDLNKGETLELLDFQLQKIKSIEGIESEEELEKQKKELENIDKIRQVDEEVKNKLDLVYKELGDIKNIVESNQGLGYDKYLEILNNSYYEIENLSFEHAKKENNLQYVNLDEIIDKLSNLRFLKRKYNLDYEGLLNKYEELKGEKTKLENLGSIIIKEEKALKLIEEKVIEKANNISDLRKQKASILEQKINKNFKDLDMPNAKLTIKTINVDVCEKGIDNVEFLLKTNKGHDMQNIMEIASGGEKSRIMLIFKMVINEFKNKKIFLLDEIDQGVSASVAKNLGLKLKDFSQDKQVFIISHTVQVINLADYLYGVKKDDSQEISTSNIQLLTKEQRSKFISRYLEI